MKKKEEKKVSPNNEVLPHILIEANGLRKSCKNQNNFVPILRFDEPKVKPKTPASGTIRQERQSVQFVGKIQSGNQVIKNSPMAFLDS